MPDPGVSPVKAVVYDIGNVLLAWRPEAHYDRVIGPERRAALFDAVDLHGMNESIDGGAAFRETVYATAEAHPDWAEDIRRWHDDWLQMASPVIDHSVRLLHRLKARGVPVFILSNIGDGNFKLAERSFDFIAAADLAFVSGRLNLMKPDPAIYAAVESGSGVAPEGLLFVDDRAENIEAAEARGWQAHLFDGPERWAARLVDAGLLTEAEAR